MCRCAHFGVCWCVCIRQTRRRQCTDVTTMEGGRVFCAAICTLGVWLLATGKPIGLMSILMVTCVAAAAERFVMIETNASSVESLSALSDVGVEMGKKAIAGAQELWNFWRASGGVAQA